MTLSPTARSTLRRHRERGRYKHAELYAVLDSALVCHLGLVLADAPVVLPTGYGRDGDTLYLHGSTGAASLLAASGERRSASRSPGWTGWSMLARRSTTP